MIVLAGADVVRPDSVLPGATLVIRDGRIAELRADALAGPGGVPGGPLCGHVIVPGFIDLHVHGLAGIDTLDAGDPVAGMAAALPAFGVTAFCPTTVACAPEALRGVLDQVRRAREHPDPASARVLPAHLESNFINPDFRGAQPLSHLRGCARSPGGRRHSSVSWADTTGADGHSYGANELLAEIERARPDVGIVTLAPELEGATDLIAWLTSRGIAVSLGHSGATFDQASAAIAAGASRATHLFNRMGSLHHREPGLVGAVLQHDSVVVEVICDGVHLHPAVVRLAVAAKTPARVVAITDGTAAAAIGERAEATLGGQCIRIADGAARLHDGTLAGSVLTMDAAFRNLTGPFGLSLVDAAMMCATTPARSLGLQGYGVIVEGAVADLVVLDGQGVVVQTYIAGRLAYARPSD